LKRVAQLAAVGGVAKRFLVRVTKRDVGELAATLVLLQKHIDEIDEPIGFSEPWKEEILLELLVIILDEASDHFGGVEDGIGRKILAAIDPTDRFAVDQENALQHAVLAHQVLGGRDLLFPFLWFLLLVRQ